MSVFYGLPIQTGKNHAKECEVIEAVREIEKDCQGNTKCQVKVGPKDLITEYEDPCPNIRYKKNSFK